MLTIQRCGSAPLKRMAGIPFGMSIFPFVRFLPWDERWEMPSEGSGEELGGEMKAGVGVGQRLLLNWLGDWPTILVKNLLKAAGSSKPSA